MRRFAWIGLLGIAALVPVQAHDVSGQIPAQEDVVEELQVQELLLQSEIRAAGGSATAQLGIAGANARIRYDMRQIAELEEVAALYGKSVEEMRELSRQFDSRPVFAMSDLAEEGVEEVGEAAAKRALVALGKKNVSRVIGPASYIGDVVEHGGKLVIRIVDASRLRQEAIAEQRHLVDVLAVIVQFQREISAEHRRIRQLRELDERSKRNFSELAEANEKLRQLRSHGAHSHANTERVTDAEGDAALAAQPDPSGGVRLCDPAQKPVPFGVRSAQKSAGNRPKPAGPKPPAPKEAAGGFVARGTCVDIVGNWTMQQGIQVHGRSAPMGPPLRAEISAVARREGEEGPPRYEIYGPDRKSAKNDPLMRCTRSGHELSCQRRVQQQACPAAKYVWAPLQMGIATDVSAITGELRQTWLMDPRVDPSGCTVVNGEGQAAIAFRLVRADR